MRCQYTQFLSLVIHKMKSLILSVLLLCMAHNSDALNVIIPDASFKNALISVGVDTSGDSEISYAECEAITNLDLFNKNISDMKSNR